MKLTKVRVENFRSVNDSTEFRVGNLTCLVGKNESGKTTVLQALAGLKPYDNEPKLQYDKLRDYPRRYLNSYDERHKNEDAHVVTSKWLLDQCDIDSLEEVLGEGCLKDNEIIIVRGYNKTKLWTIDIDEEQVVASLIERAGCNKVEKANLKGIKTVHSLSKHLDVKEGVSSTLSGLKASIKKLRDASVFLAAIDILDSKLPGFLYFATYDRMAGDVSLEALQKAKAIGALTSDQKVFQAFLDFAGTSPDELARTDRYEDLKAQVEAASISITDQIFDYWSQNRHLSVEFEVTEGKPSDPAPLNSGKVMRARIRNDLHRMTVPFSERSAGFIWFFSFLVLFSQVTKEHGEVVIILDEPGLNLHATAQADLLQYIRDKLLPNHQVIYSTHSPFMIPMNDLSTVRTVEDVVRTDNRGRPNSVGTVVSDDVLSTDRETLFPLQAALGYGITQSLFVGEHTLIVEGPAEILYFQAISAELDVRGRIGLDRRWTTCSSNGVDKVQAFLSLFGGNRLHCAVLIDLAKGQKGKIESLRRLEGSLLQAGHVFTVADFTETDEADVEDLFDASLFAAILNGTYELTNAQALTGPILIATEANGSERLVKKAEQAINTRLPSSAGEMSHYAPARWLIAHPEILSGDSPSTTSTLNKFEKVFSTLNKLLPSI